MGRVYEALKRAAEATQNNNGDDHTPHSNSGNGSEPTSRVTTPVASANAHRFNVESVEDLLATTTSRTFAPASPHEAAHHSASTGQTDLRTETALSAAPYSRAAGATLDAVSSTRTQMFPQVEISAARVEPHLVTITQPRSVYTEQYRSLRTRILQAGERNKLQIFVVSSAGTAEGKTVSAINLAWILAQSSGVRALLIDGDLRRPCALDYLGINAEQAATGLSDILTGHATLESAVIQLEPSGLHLLPGGAARDDVADLLSGQNFKNLLAEARRMFDYIIIDAPPLGIFTDAAMLMNRADATLFVVRSGHVRYAALNRLLAPLPQERILGIILNGTDEKIENSNYYYQKRYTQRDAPTRGAEN